MSSVKKIPILFMVEGVGSAVDASASADYVSIETEEGTINKPTAMRYSKDLGISFCSEEEFAYLMATVYSDYAFEDNLRFKSGALVLPLLEVLTTNRTQARLDANNKPIQPTTQAPGESESGQAIQPGWSVSDTLIATQIGTAKTPNKLFAIAPMEADSLPPGSVIDVGNGLVLIRQAVVRFRAKGRAALNSGNSLLAPAEGDGLKAPKLFVEAWYRARYGVEYDYSAPWGSKVVLPPLPKPSPVPPAQQPAQVQQNKPAPATTSPIPQQPPPQPAQGALSKFRVGLVLGNMVIKNCTDQNVYIAGALCQGTSDIIRPEIVDTPPDEMGIVSRKVVWELPEQKPNTILIVDRDCRLANAHRADLVSFEGGQLIKNAGAGVKKGRRFSLNKPKRREKHEAITNAPQ
jgi:hypothetical protein